MYEWQWQLKTYLAVQQELAVVCLHKRVPNEVLHQIATYVPEPERVAALRKALRIPFKHLPKITGYDDGDDLPDRFTETQVDDAEQFYTYRGVPYQVLTEIERNQAVEDYFQDNLVDLVPAWLLGQFEYPHYNNFTVGAVRHLCQFDRIVARDILLGLIGNNYDDALDIYADEEAANILSQTEEEWYANHHYVYNVGTNTTCDSCGDYWKHENPEHLCHCWCSNCDRLLRDCRYQCRHD